MRIAILLCGHIRTFESCKKSLLKAISQANNRDVDFFVHTYTKQYSYHPFIAGKIGIPDEINNKTVSDKLFPDNYHVVIEEELVERDVPDLDKYPINLDIYSQIRKIRLCNEMRKEWERKNNFKYDLVIRTRMDVQYSESIIPSKLEENTIYIPKCIETLSPSDVCYMGKSETIDKIITSLSSEYSPKIINPHIWLKICLEGIKQKSVRCELKVIRWSLE